MCACVCVYAQQRAGSARRIQTEISKVCTLRRRRRCCFCCWSFFYKSLVFAVRDDDAAGAVGCAAASCTRRTFALAHSRCDRVELHNVNIRGLRRLRLQETLNNLRNFTHTTVPRPLIVYKNKKHTTHIHTFI